MMSFFRSLRFRLIILVIATLLPGLVLIFYESLEQRRQAMGEAQDQLKHLVAHTAGVQENLAHGTRQLLLSLSQLPAIQKRQAAISSALASRLLKENPNYINIGAIAPDGNVFCSGQPLRGPVNLGDREYFHTAMRMRDFAVSNIVIGRISTPKPGYVYAYPAVNETGQVQAVAFVALGMPWLNKLATQAHMPAGSTLTIIDQQGAIMARYPDPEKWVGKSMPPGGLLNIIQQRGQGIAEAKGMDGVPRVYAFTSLGREPKLGFAYAGIPTEVVYAEANRVLGRDLAAMGGALLIALVCSWVLGNLIIVRRMNPLMGATARLAAGDLEARIGLIGGPEEFNQLAHAFDHLAATLQEQESQRKRAEEALRRNLLRYRSFVDITQFAWVTDINGQVVEDIPGLRRFTGQTYEEAKGDGWANMLHPDDLQRTLAVWCQAVTTKTLYETEYRMRRHDGVYRTLLAKGVPILNDDGSILEWAGTCLDITGIKKTEEALRDSEEKYRGLVETTSTGFVILDLEGRVLDANREYVRLTGHKELAEILGRSVLEWTVEEDQKRNALEVKKCLEQGSIKNLEINYAWKDGRLIPVEINATAISDSTGHKILSLVRDITERKRAEEEIVHQREELRGLATRLAEVEEMERQRLASELHDDVCQNLASIGINLEILKLRASQEPLDQWVPRLVTSSELVEQTGNITRNIMEGLRPTVLDHYGLMGGLRYVANEFQKKTGVVIEILG